MAELRNNLPIILEYLLYVKNKVVSAEEFNPLMPELFF